MASLNADLRMLASAEWYARMRALGIRAGTVKLFSARLVTRDASGWTITEVGRELLARLERGERVAEGPAVRLVSSADPVDAGTRPDDVAALRLSKSA